MTNFDWENNPQGGGDEPKFAEKMGAGLHEASIVKVIHGGKNGPFVSNSGDPKILIVFENKKQQEAATMVTLSEKAGWVLVNFLKEAQPKIDLKQMTADGITPMSFAEPEFADLQLVGKKIFIEVAPREYNGNIYTDITPKPAPVDMTESPADMEVPF
tara:strand:+ start:784 stop:1257 length:474 start_codon:yes stop_codon:yes gene_type:complete